MSQHSRSTDDLPPALEQGPTINAEILERLRGHHPAVFIDYDGTLTPIVERPEDAVLSDESRRAVARLARCCAVAVISGRGLDDVRRLVGLEQIYYAGSHGFRIAGPRGTSTTHEAGARFLPAVDRAEQELAERLSRVEGSQIERKDVAVAVHYRRVAEERREEVARAVRRVARDHEGELKLTEGKMVLELRPALEWHKGKAVLWLLERLELDGPRSLPLFLGDDVTDEDGFAALANRGLGIVVRDADDPRPTAARYALADPDEVRVFLDELAGVLDREANHE